MISKRPALPAEHRIAQDYGRFLADMEQLLHSARQLNGSSASLARHRIEDRVAQAKVRLEAARVSVAESALALPRRSYARVARIAAFAALAALVAGLWWSRRSH